MGTTKKRIPPERMPDVYLLSNILHDRLTNEQFEHAINNGVSPMAKKVAPPLHDKRQSDGEQGFWAVYRALSVDHTDLAGWEDAVKTDAPPIEEEPPVKEEDEQDARTHVTATGKRVFNRHTEDDIDQFPDLEFLITHILPSVGVALLYGLSGSGKSFNALHIAQCIARGLFWFGRKVMQGDVLYIYAEGKLGLKPRLQAWRSHYGKGKTSQVTYIGVPVHLKGDRQTLIDTVEDMLATGANLRLLIIDTFSNCANGIDQNLQKEVAELLAICHEIKEKFGILVLLIHHTNKAGDFNGTMAFRNHVDTMIELIPGERQKGADVDPLTMHCEKQRDGAEKFQDIPLCLEKIDLGISPVSGMELSSCVVTLPTAHDATNGKTKQSEKEERLLSVCGLLRMHGSMNTRPLIDACKDIGISKRVFYDEKIIDVLLERKAIVATTTTKNGVSYALAGNDGAL